MPKCLCFAKTPKSRMFRVPFMNLFGFGRKLRSTLALKDSWLLQKARKVFLGTKIRPPPRSSFSARNTFPCEAGPKGLARSQSVVLMAMWRLAMLCLLRSCLKSFGSFVFVWSEKGNKMPEKVAVLQFS